MSTRATASISNMVKHVAIKQPGAPDHPFGDLEAYRNGTGDGPKNISLNTMRDWHANHARGGASFSTVDQSETKMSDYMSIINGEPSRWKVLPLVCFMRFKAETSSLYGTNNNAKFAIKVQGNHEWTANGGPGGSAKVQLKTGVGVGVPSHGSGAVLKTWNNVTHDTWSYSGALGGSLHYDISIYWNDLNGETPQWEHHFRFQLGTVNDNSNQGYYTDRMSEDCSVSEHLVLNSESGVFYDAGAGLKFRPALWGTDTCPGSSTVARPDNTVAQTWSRTSFVGLPPGKDDTTGINTGTL